MRMIPCSSPEEMWRCQRCNWEAMKDIGRIMTADRELLGLEPSLGMSGKIVQYGLNSPVEHQDSDWV